MEKKIKIKEKSQRIQWFWTIKSSKFFVLFIFLHQILNPNIVLGCIKVVFGYGFSGENGKGNERVAGSDGLDLISLPNFFSSTNSSLNQWFKYPKALFSCQ